MGARTRIAHGAFRFAALLAALTCATAAKAQNQDQSPDQTRRQIQEQIQELPPQQFRISDDLTPNPVLMPADARRIKVDPHVLADVKQLEDPSFALREDATKRLLDASTDKMQLYALLCGNQLTTEQRYRLLTVVRELLLNTPRGAIGISMNQFQAVAGGPLELRVADLIPGLPAEKVLQLNDRITEIDGQPLMMPDELQFRVQSKRPGEKVMLTVKRLKPKDEAPKNGEAPKDNDVDPVKNADQTYDTLHVQIELGSAELLKDQKQFNQFSQAANRLEMTRQLEAAYVARDCAPKSREIAVRGGVRQWLTESGRSSTLPPSIDDGSVDMPVNQDPAIQLLLSERQQVAQGMLPEQAARELWQDRLAELTDRLRDPDLSREQAQYLKRVIKRFRELIAD